MLKTLTLLQGRKGYKTPLVVGCEGVTIFVGPNNSGKSLALAELFRLLSPAVDQSPRSPLLTPVFSVNDVDPHAMLHTLCSAFTVASRPNTRGEPEMHMIFRSYHRPDVSGHLPYTDVEQRLISGDRTLIKSLIGHLSIHLSGRTRFNLLTPRQMDRLFGGERNILATLYHNPASVDAVNQLLRDFFGYEMFIDLSGLPTLSVRLSREGVPPKIHVDKSATNEVADWCRKQLPLDQASDGVQCLVSILSAIHANRSSIILIDEPEGVPPPIISQAPRRSSWANYQEQARECFCQHSQCGLCAGLC